jgi:hypothetical protein
MTGRENEASNVAAVLANVLKIDRNSLCFCGSLRKFKACCGSGSGDNLIFVERALDIAKAYRKSQGGGIKFVPAGIWKKFEKASLSRLRCLYPGCNEKPASCHLIPENILRSNYGGHCKEYKIKDSSGLEFTEVGIGGAGCLPVFCSKHDHDLFNTIDQLRIDFSSGEQLFPFALKAISFSLRKTQYLLGIDSQIEILRPFLIQEVHRHPSGSHLTIDISHLQEQYIRFRSVYDFFKDSIKAYESRDWDFYLHLHRPIQHARSIFFAGFFNPSHDLNGRKINNSDQAIAMACNSFTVNGYFHALFSCPRGLSTDLYRDFFKQLEDADERTFITILNNLLTFSTETLLLPETFSPNQDDLQKITSAHQLAARAVKSGGPIFDLKDANQAITFL